MVAGLKSATRGYLWRKNNSYLRAQWTRKFFIVHNDSITSHEDHLKTSKIESAVKLSEGAVTIEERDNCVVAIMRDAQDVMVLRAEDAGECRTWIAAIQAAIISRNEEGGVVPAGADGAGGGAADEGIIHQEILEVRSDKTRGATWEANFFVLTSNSLKRYESEAAKEERRPIETFRISPQCCVFETNLAANAFELVTSKKVLHVAGPSAEVSETWIRSLRRLITESQVIQGPLLDRVLERWGAPADGNLGEASDFYQVNFEVKKPLGLVLERSSEWAIVKLSNTQDTGVTMGSVLYSVNGKAVTLQTYPETISLLTGACRAVAAFISSEDFSFFLSFSSSRGTADRIAALSSSPTIIPLTTK